MKRYFSGKMKVTLLIALILAAALAILGAVRGGTPLPEKVVQAVMTPVRNGLDALTRQAERLYGYVFRYESLEAENQQLRERIAQLEDEARSTDTLQRENQRLRELLELTEEHEDYVLVSGYIISWDATNWAHSFTLNRGSSSGIANGMCVVTAQGQVVGLVTEVGVNWATVTTILDSSLEISATMTSSGYNGIVQGAYITGQQGMLRVNYLPADAVVRNGDQVVTAGSTVYPRDLILGYVADAGFDETGVAKYALLEPAVDFNSLEQVFVLTEYTVEQPVRETEPLETTAPQETGGPTQEPAE